MYAFPQRYDTAITLTTAAANTDAVDGKIGNGCLMKLQSIVVKSLTDIDAAWEFKLYDAETGDLLLDDSTSNAAVTHADDGVVMIRWAGIQDVAGQAGASQAGEFRTILFRKLRAEFTGKDGSNAEGVEVRLSAVDPVVAMNS